MSYLKIPNLYQAQTILLFRECYALEKVHGTAAHVRWDGKAVGFSSGGEGHVRFIALFDAAALTAAFTEHFGEQSCVVFGEAYGGKQQGVSATYGKTLKFVVFDVKVTDLWLAVPQAEDVARKLGLEFVHYRKIPTTLEAIDAERDAPSVQAQRNGIVEPRKREGVVLRPLIELRMNNGERVIAKHKGDEFRETKTPREVDPAQVKRLEDANEIADEWCTPNRLRHVLDKIEGLVGIERTGDVIKAMVADVLVEAGDEVADSKDARVAIGRKTATLFKAYLKARLVDRIGEPSEAPTQYQRDAESLRRERERE